MPLDVLTDLLFFQPAIKVEDIISALVPKYPEEEDIEVFCFESQMRVLEIVESDDKKRIRKGILIDLLKGANQAFLKDFLWFTTGYEYMPRSNFTITVEFNYDENMDEGSLPVAHTCIMLLKLPYLAYDSNPEVLEQKLKQSIEFTREVKFDME
jgi:HECT-domain (ubiquitin-transferase)